jgi:hypothetical protein
MKPETIRTILIGLLIIAISTLTALHATVPASIDAALGALIAASVSGLAALHVPAPGTVTPDELDKLANDTTVPGQ